MKNQKCIKCKYCSIHTLFEKNKILKYYIYCKKYEQHIAGATKEEILTLFNCKEK